VDFFSQKVLTVKGIREVFLIAFLHVETRRVIVTPATYHPDEAWVTGQVETFVKEARGSGLRIGTIQHDRDKKFSAAVDRAFRQLRCKVKLTAYRSPNTNAFVERFIQSIQQECLDHFLVFGEKHCDVLVREYVAYYLTQRPHQGRDNELLNAKRPRGRTSKLRGEVEEPMVSIDEVRCDQRLGGLLKSYRRAA
jgi:putative transposase